LNAAQGKDTDAVKNAAGWLFNKATGAGEQGGGLMDTVWEQVKGLAAEGVAGLADEGKTDRQTRSKTKQKKKSESWF